MAAFARRKGDMMSEPLAFASLKDAGIDHIHVSATSPQLLRPCLRTKRFLGRNVISNRQSPRVETAVTYSKERMAAAPNRQKSRLLRMQL